MIIKRAINLPVTKSFFLFGPRLTGKSTLLKTNYMTGKGIFYIDLLDTYDLMRYLQDASAFYREIKAAQNETPIIIVDEIQKIPILLNEIHRLLEEFPHLQFIMSGSSARKLKKMKANLLGGRALTYYLGPFSFLELNDKFHLIRALELGTLPPVYLEKEDDIARDILRSYVKTYLEEEIKQESLVRNLGAFAKFLPLAGEESGNILNFSNLSREIGVSYKTVQEYFQIMVDTLIIFFLPSFARSKRKSLIQHSKFYFFDTGVLRSVKNELRLPLRPGTRAFGTYFEHFIINELKRYNDYKKLDCSFFFFRTTTGQEVDLVLEKPGKKLVAVEIKARDRVGKMDFKGLYHFKRMFPQSRLILVSLVPRTQIFDDITVIPWQKVFDVFK
jgi:predicted AAA+ superfamily ATPase